MDKSLLKHSVSLTHKHNKVMFVFLTFLHGVDFIQHLQFFNKIVVSLLLSFLQLEKCSFFFVFFFGCGFECPPVIVKKTQLTYTDTLLLVVRLRLSVLDCGFG